MRTLSFKLLLLTIMMFVLSMNFQHAYAGGTAEYQREIAIDIHKGRLIQLPVIPDTMFIADNNIADLQVKSPGVIHIFGKKIGQTTLYGIAKNGKPIVNYRVTIQHNLTELRGVLKRVFPEADIKVESVNDAILLRGFVSSPSQAADAKKIAEQYLMESDRNRQNGNTKLLNFLKITRAMQVNLRVTIVEMTREIRKALGVTWQGTVTAGTALFGLATGVVPVTDDVITAGLQSAKADLTAFINLLDAQRLINVLSEPNLTALSGETATFLAGGEFPIISPQGRDDPALVSFKEFGVSLAFTPTLLSDKTINLRVRPEVSQLSETGAVELNGFNVPSLTTRRADTTVQLRSGQSLVIAGLLQDSATFNVKNFPGLARVPILGKLFRSQRFQKDQTELVIIVTPYTVDPVEKGKLTSPAVTLVSKPTSISTYDEQDEYSSISYTID